ncbi:MAG: hypothetical protein IJ629_05525 [Clostridia bacterium]|nr:hypothetical protein [Clostridia bacterium]
MAKKDTGMDLYDSVAATNEGVTRNDVKRLFIWYDLLSYALPFQLIFIFIYYLIGSNYYPFTMCSVLFIFVMDAILKDSLERDGKNYEKFNKHIPLVKLWVIPLIFMGLVTSVALLMATLGLI